MQTIKRIHTEHAIAEVQHLLEAVDAEFGRTSNMMKTMAQSPAALEGYLRFSRALSSGQLSPKFREQIALAVAQANGCEYCLAAHSASAAKLGLDGDEILASRQARSADTRTAAGLKFARDIVAGKGDCSIEHMGLLRQAGYSEGEIVEIIANVGLNLFANYFNLVVDTDIDFPKVVVKAA